MKVKAIVFDLFHTLISFKTDGVSGLSTSDILGVPENDWNALLFEQSEKRLRGHIKDPVQILTGLVECGGWNIAPQKISEAAKARQKRFAEGMMAVQPHVLKTLEHIRNIGVVTGLCSNADWMERDGWEDSPLSGLFDVAIFSCDVGHLKPEPEIYQICLKKMNVKPENTIFVGDGGSNELAGAKKVGMKTVMTTEIILKLWPEKIAKRSQVADHIIDHIGQITDYLK